ncbi:hypothetical protein FE810_08365 [Thalassotalea litorea]|uniref:ATPase dynein-related AAA domain-containing protein n=1 Tax=Thalassotalea litorea TaxID=2020715 RepID=A0A5R9ITN8_9GAMM|nr:AAA family ATPase [Thalassotalea litorea]TLU65298.1 hypothetical protein FE810_08365 [Thalassotalea litorea]
MYYLDYSVVVKALDKVIIERKSKIDNGIIGTLYCFKHSSQPSDKITEKRIPFDPNRVTIDLNHIFSFYEIIEEDFDPKSFFILSKDFDSSILQHLKGEKIDALSLAVILLQSEAFEQELFGSDLISYFIEKFNLPKELIETCFESTNDSIQLAYTDKPTDLKARRKLITEIIPYTKNKLTLDLKGGWLKVAAGSFGQGAYAQKLTTTSNLKDFIFVPKGELQESLSFTEPKATSVIRTNELNVLFFGPSGTGKSTEARRELSQDKGVVSRNITQITFHPEYSYSDFVGSLKPNTLYKNNIGSSYFSSLSDSKPIYKDKEPVVEFKYEPGPFLSACIKAANDDPLTPHALIIDEINRGNVPEIMGDIFQLLDRDLTNYSNSNSELLKYLKEHDKNNVFINGLVIPNNLYIYATINPADQNVYPLDTAFKRRWKRRFWDINYTQEYCNDWRLSICNKDIQWLRFISYINSYLTTKLHLSEDKQLGQFFIKLSSEKNKQEIDEETLKVIGYLWEEIPKSKRGLIFSENIHTFSDIYKQINANEPFSVLFHQELASNLSKLITPKTSTDTDNK